MKRLLLWLAIALAMPLVIVMLAFLTVSLGLAGAL